MVLSIFPPSLTKMGLNCSYGLKIIYSDERYVIGVMRQKL